MRKLSVGIDIGGTKTSVWAAELSLGEIHTVRTREWRQHDWTKDARALIELADLYCQKQDGVIDALAVGANGCDSDQECLAFQRALALETHAPVKVVNDAELMTAAMDVPNGIGLVCGTGSIAVARDSRGHLTTAGGWGWVLGDEGSAPGLVREAGRLAYLHVDTGGSNREPLVEGLCRALSIESHTRLGSAVARHRSAEELGHHAPVVFKAASEGSELASKVIRDGASSLVDLIERLKDNGAEADKVVAGGGVITAQPMLAEHFIAGCQERFNSHLQVKLIDQEPVLGAVKIASSLSQEH